MLVSVGLLGGLAACAGSADRYPSLALSQFETAATMPQSAPPPPPIRSDTDQAAIAALGVRADSAHAAFESQHKITEPLARTARGLSADDNRRGRALVAMADLSSRRSATAAVLADLDALAAEADVALVPDAGLAAAQARIAALLANEDAALARLWEVMGS